ncbi:AAA family ATPase [Deinococcus oregonensis]|uniref:AAA family ATPase n=1 Tax=Deinococcus oregonensis TaxID=1805970 RepID=A0ABV6B5Y5_9DEIO
MPHLQLFLLGAPRAVVGGQTARLRTRKMLALLAYLALEPGPHPRRDLSALFWPGPPTPSRNALRVALHHLNTALGPGLLVGTAGTLELLRTCMWSDAQALIEAAKSGTVPVPVADLDQWPGEFLLGLELQASAEWDSWVTQMGLRLSQHADTLLSASAQSQFMAGRVPAALAAAQRRTELDPLNHGAYEQLVQLQRAAGRVVDAQQTERQRSDTLQREWGIGVRGTAHMRAGSRPALVGRSSLFQQMDEAWSRGQVVFLSGEAGVGKTRLAETFFAERQLDHFTVVAQAPDAVVPYAVHARSLRVNLAFLGHPPVPSRLRYELARTVPELWADRPRPLRTAAQRLRFYEAYIDFLAEVCPAYTPQLFENLHHWDQDSYQLGAYASAHGPPRGAHVRALMTFRPNELPAGMQGGLAAALEQGGAVVLEVPRLDIGGVHELLAQVEPNASGALADRLHRFTGGNPLFVLETASLLRASGGLTHPDYRELPRSREVGAVIARRFSRLSSAAQEVAQVAALAGAEFTFQVAVQVLGTELSVAAAFQELETAGIFQQERFAHDLLSLTAHDLTPPRVKTVVHRRLLTALRSTRASAATLARHAVAGECWPEAQALLLEASRDAADLLSSPVAQAFAAQAAALSTGPRSS